MIPPADYLKPPLQAYRLIEEKYWPIPAETLPDGSRVIHSAVLRLDLRLENGILRFYDPLTGQKLLSHEEAEQAPQQAEQARREAEERARREAEERQALEEQLAEFERRRAVRKSQQVGQKQRESALPNRFPTLPGHQSRGPASRSSRGALNFSKLVVKR